jgi:RecA-family ATPase
MTLAEFLAGFTPPDYVLDGILKRGFLYALTAMTGAGKTAIALLLAEIAANRKRRRKLGPHDVEHVRVVYIACENADDVRMRLIGMESKMDFNRDNLDMLIIDSVFDLEKNLDRIRKEVDDFGGKIGLVVIDTSAAMFQGDDDNNNIQALAHAKAQRKLCELPGRPCVLALVHPMNRQQAGRSAAARWRRLSQRSRW